METERQMLFRKYSEHIVECQQCKQTPRCPDTMCDLGKAILVQYREALNRDSSRITELPDPHKAVSRMSWEELAHTLYILENKPVKTSDDINLIKFIDSLLVDIVEIIAVPTDIRGEGK